MDKTCGSSSGEESAVTNPNPGTISSDNSTGTGGTNPGIIGGKDQYLKQLNKFSHKISKHPIRKPFDHLHQGHQNLHQLPLGLEDKQQQNQSQLSNLQQQQHQPPVYNINKSDFRDVVQKLTGSPAHERVPAQQAAPPSVHHHQQPKPQSSRLQRIRPPPLEHLSNRPPPMLNDAGVGVVLPPPNPSSSNNVPAASAAVSGNFFGGQRQPHQPLSPLPPFPTVHAAAESPISAYLRTFQTSNTGVPGHSPLASPRWNRVSQPTAPPPPPQNLAVPPATSVSLLPLNFPAPSSPLPFGCLPSPKSQFPMLSPGFPFSPTNQFGFQQFAPLSPTLPVPSPRWKGL